METVTMYPTMERELEQAGTMMIREADEMRITCSEDYDRGTAILKDIKAHVKAVKDYWKGPKEAANAAHKEIVAKESAMLKPLQEAEGIIKKAMLTYTAEVERQRREAEEAARKAREEEVRRLEAIAAKAEEQGDSDTADVLRDMAEEVPVGEISAEAAPKGGGVSVRKTWKARVTDPKAVPAYFEGVELRAISMTALNNFAKWSEGKAQIPGVEFYVDSTMAVRV